MPNTPAVSVKMYTPGPWQQSETPNWSGTPENVVRFAIVGSDGISVCACASSVKRAGDEKAANARLIAAAPELLAALDEIATTLELHNTNRRRTTLYECQQLAGKARAAIARATRKD